MYGGDPYVELPSSYSGDPFLKYVFWANAPTYYGPLWTLVSRGLVLLGGEDVGRTVAIFRGLSIGATLVTAFLIWWSLARRWPNRAVQGLVFFLWSPLVVIELGLSAHNEAFMLVFIALAVTLYLSRRHALGSAALVLEDPTITQIGEGGHASLREGTREFYLQNFAMEHTVARLLADEGGG